MVMKENRANFRRGPALEVALVLVSEADMTEISIGRRQKLDTFVIQTLGEGGGGEAAVVGPPRLPIFAVGMESRARFSKRSYPSIHLAASQPTTVTQQRYIYVSSILPKNTNQES